MNKKKLLLVALVIMIVPTLTTGCFWKPYKEPVFKNIKPNETAYLIPLEGDNKDSQEQFKSEKYVESMKVPTKRVKIPRDWVSDGWLPSSGYYQEEAKLIRVDRTPITREWTSDPNTGSNSSNDALKAESIGSIPFNMKANITAKIERGNASKYLYYYNKKDLSWVMDNEVRPFVESKLAEIASNMELKEIIKKKDEIINKIREETKSRFNKKGVTIAVLGLKGQIGLEKEIQNSINQKFKEQKQLEADKIARERELMNKKEKAKAELEAQRIKNKKRIELAEAKAKEAKIMKDSLEFQIKIKELKNQKLMYQQWDGELPNISTGSNGGNFMLNLDKKDLNNK